MEWDVGGGPLGGFSSAGLAEATEFLLLTKGEACWDLPILNPERKSITSCISWSVGRFIPWSSAMEPLANGLSVAQDRLPIGRMLCSLPSLWPMFLAFSSGLLLVNMLRDGVLGIEKLPPLLELEDTFLVNLDVSLDIVFGSPPEVLELVPSGSSAWLL